MQVAGVKLVAAADCYDGRLFHCKERWGNDLFTTRDYQEILARQETDAVIIGAPDHWHKQAALDAMTAGKDVYLEKPMIHIYPDGPEIIARRKRRNASCKWAASGSARSFTKRHRNSSVGRDRPTQHRQRLVGPQ